VIPLRDNIVSRSFPFISWLLLLTNAYVFFLELQAGPQLETFIRTWALTPKILFSDPVQYSFTVVTAMFLHGGWMHVISNMLFLYIFGDNVEDRLGHFKFLIFYLLTGIIANLVQAWTTPTSTIFLLGASGAIAGVLGAYFFYYPHSRVVTLIPIGFFITIREIPAFFFLGFWFIIQVFSGAGSLMTAQESTGGVAWWAHASGFVAGLVLAPIFGGRTSKYR